MKSIVLHAPGGTENFIIEERPIPTPPVGWVLIQIKAFGLNHSELMTRKGLSPSVTFPRVLGMADSYTKCNTAEAKNGEL